MTQYAFSWKIDRREYLWEQSKRCAEIIFALCLWNVILSCALIQYHRTHVVRIPVNGRSIRLNLPIEIPKNFHDTSSERVVPFSRKTKEHRYVPGNDTTQFYSLFLYDCKGVPKILAVARVFYPEISVWVYENSKPIKIDHRKIVETLVELENKDPCDKHEI